MTRSRCGDVVRYVLRTSSPHKLYQVYDDVNVFLDFEHCHPNESELYLFHKLEQIIASGDLILADLSNYGIGASVEIRLALQSPDDFALQKQAFKLVEGFMQRINSYFVLSKQIQEVLPGLLWELCSGPLPPAEQIDSTQALCKQFARLIDFVLRFDFLKMNTPAMQNDISFYRRLISRNDNGIGENAEVSLEEANYMTLFFAGATPMLNCLANTTISFVKEHPDLPVSNTTETLTAIVYICCHMISRQEFYEKLTEKDRMFFLRVMVGALILFDHIDSEGGAFCRHSPIDVKGIVEAIKQCGNDQEDQLMNALRYTTKHFNDQDTPKSIRALFNQS